MGFTCMLLCMLVQAVRKKQTKAYRALLLIGPSIGVRTLVSNGAIQRSFVPLLSQNILLAVCIGYLQVREQALDAMH